MTLEAGSRPEPLFKAGDLVTLRSNPGAVMAVIAVALVGLEHRYTVLQNGAMAMYYESQLQAVIDEGARKPITAAELQAHLTSLQILAPSTANLFSLHLGRIQFVPYQYRPVLKLIQGDRPRLLIADEVGVGKTIEAGLIIKELSARMDLSSILIICPKALAREGKWLTEMKRFDEKFSVLDGPLLRHCLQEAKLEGEWPEQHRKAILPFSLLNSDYLGGSGERTKRARILDMDPPLKFDLVIVDEAHHIRNTETLVHLGVRYFCDNAEAVLLLTATPVQLGSEDLLTLLNVIRPDLIPDRVSFEYRAEPNRHIHAAVQRAREAGERWELETLAHLHRAAYETEWGRQFLREDPALVRICERLQAGSVSDAERVQLIPAIEKLSTFSSLISRTRRRDIGDFTTRRPETVAIPFTPQQRRLHDALLAVIAGILRRRHDQQDVKFMMSTIRRQAASCLYGLKPLLGEILMGKIDEIEVEESSDADVSDVEITSTALTRMREDIQQLLQLAEDLDEADPKVEAFIRIVRDKNQRSNNKVLVFSTFRHTLRYLETHLRQTGLRFGVIHGDVPDSERTELRRRFARAREDPEAIDVLLSSEVGCEGLDFQFCDCLINYDLPWNPMRIEQRIGRIDRFGQKSEAVAIVNLITPDTVDADIYERCLQRIGVFQHAVGGNEEVLGEITEELHDIGERFDLSREERKRRLQQLADNAIWKLEEERKLEEKQAQLFGLNVPKRSWEEEIKNAESFWLAPAALQQIVTRYLAARLGEGEYILREQSLRKTLRLNQQAREKLLEDYRKLPRAQGPVEWQWENWLKAGSPTLPVTFEQETAREQTDVVHLSVVHPLVRQAARYWEIREPKRCRLRVRTEKQPAGTYQFAVYCWRKQGVRDDQALVAVAEDPQIEASLFDLLQEAADTEEARLPDEEVWTALEERHYERWAAERERHCEENRQIVQQRIESLTVSHAAWRRAIEDSVAHATDPRILRMRQGQLARAEADFERRKAELERAANSGDIQMTPVVFGTLLVEES